MNAASEHKEGVWEFMTFLLREENQYFIGVSGFLGNFPVSLQAFKEVEQLLLIGKLSPWRSRVIMNIIVEECDAYFSGDKPIEEVCDTVENRVQLYLDELD